MVKRDSAVPKPRQPVIIKQTVRFFLECLFIYKQANAISEASENKARQTPTIGEMIEDGRT